MSPKRTRRRHPAELKAEVAPAAPTERQPLADLAAHYQLHSLLVRQQHIQQHPGRRQTAAFISSRRAQQRAGKKRGFS